jgi:hypothetical protein
LRRTPTVLALILASAPVGQARAAETPPSAAFPAGTSPQFCIAVQQKIATTALVGDNTLFADMPSYRHSKPSAQPLKIFQVVTYAGHTPLAVSCKMKTAAHLCAAYGPDKAGTQLFCHDIAALLRRQAVDELHAEGRAEAADRVAAFIVDHDEPFVTGQAYLSDFRPTYTDAEGRVHITSPGLFQDYDAWYTFLLPEIVQGQSYCHFATVESLKAIATGQLNAGTTVTTQDDAPTQPR